MELGPILSLFLSLSLSHSYSSHSQRIDPDGEWISRIIPRHKTPGARLFSFLYPSLYWALSTEHICNESSSDDCPVQSAGEDVHTGSLSLRAQKIQHKTETVLIPGSHEYKKSEKGNGDGEPNQSPITRGGVSPLSKAAITIDTQRRARRKNGHKIKTRSFYASDFCRHFPDRVKVPSTEMNRVSFIFLPRTVFRLYEWISVCVHGMQNTRFNKKCEIDIIIRWDNNVLSISTRQNKIQLTTAWG